MAYFIKQTFRKSRLPNFAVLAKKSFFDKFKVVSNMTTVFENYSLKHIQITYFWS